MPTAHECRKDIHLQDSYITILTFLIRWFKLRQWNVAQEHTVKGLGDVYKEEWHKWRKHGMNAWFSHTGKDEILIKISSIILCNSHCPHLFFLSLYPALALWEIRNRTSAWNGKWHSCNYLFFVCVMGWLGFAYVSVSAHLHIQMIKCSPARNQFQNLAVLS